MTEWEEKKRREAKKRIIPSKNRNVQSEEDRKKDRQQRIQQRERKGERLYKFIVTALFIGIIFMSIYVLFFVQNITVQGNEYHGANETINSVKEDKYAFNSIYLYLKYNYMDTEIPVYLEDMSVKLESPWNVKLLVEEKAMIGGVELPDRYAYFDSKGIVIYESELLLESIPIVDGLEVEDTKLYQKVSVDDDEIFDNVLTATSVLERNEIEIDSISCGVGAKIILKIGGVTIQLGDDQLEDKIIQIPAAMEKVGDLPGTLYMENFNVNDGTISFVKENNGE